ncbi:MAG: hypothetical protein JST68_08580 [Bacteroidetes bacterium]|nr:hypothetical protein [Bacteroidota bacterium]
MKKIYQWHRRLSIIIAIPVLLWASSGFMHPLMTNIRPAVATQGWPAVAVDSSRLRVGLSEAMRRHHLDSCAAVRLVHIDTNWFYQVQTAVGAEPVYLSCTNGNVLVAGDWLYAQYLARYFLEGAADRSAAPQAGAMVHAGMGNAPDCCGEATECVLNPSRGAKVANVSFLKQFDKEYKSINRLLPVYRVDFVRKDGIRIYVETTQDRFSFAMDSKRAFFDEVFRLFHTWGWLDVLGRARIAVEFLVALLAFVTAVLGVYIFFTTKGGKSRRYHRYTAIVAVLFTLFWSFSGGYHAFTKLVSPEEEPRVVLGRFGAMDIDLARLQAAAGRPVAGVGICRIEGEVYWRVSLLPSHAGGQKDLMKDGKASMPPVLYMKAGDYSVLTDGDRRYALSLAGLYSGRPPGEATPVTAFNDEYNFTDKRLPVWRVAYTGAGHPRYYVETCSGQQAAFVNDAAYAEGYSFSVFHKHHFMDWGGKTVRDGSTMFWAFAQVLMVSLGLVLYFRTRRRKLRSLR